MTSIGTIGIYQHRIDCIIGINPGERLNMQTIFVDAEIKIDFAPVLQSGEIADTINYVDIANVCTELAQNNQYLIVEIFASDLLNQFKKKFKAISGKVKIQKPSAIPSAEYAYIEMEYS